MNHEPITEANAAEAMAELRRLMPTLGQLGLNTDAPNPSSLTPGNLAVGRMMNIRRHLRASWLMVEGWLTKGRHKKRPTYDVPYLQPGDQGFDERKHSFALRLGGTWVGPNRFSLGGHIIDNYGAFKDENACPVCASLHGEFRYMVRQGPTPQMKRWESTWTYCPRCCTPLEIEEWRYQQEHPRKGQEPPRMHRS